MSAWLPLLPEPFPEGMPRAMVPVSAPLVNVSPEELATLIEQEIPFHPLHNENGGVFFVETLYETLLDTDDELFAIFAYAKKQGADYVIASVHKEPA